jgi:hypothetical protein
MPHSRSRLVLLGLLITVPAVLQGQIQAPEFNIGIGPTFSTSQSGEHVPMGLNVNAGLGLTPRDTPLGVRVEGLYSGFNGRGNYAIVCSGGGSCSGGSYVSGLTLNV